MGFNFKALLGGMAEGVSEKIDLDEKKKYLRDEKTADRLYEKTEEDRLYKRDLREKKKKLTGDIAENLALYYTPDQIKDILPSGHAAANYAIAFGAEKAKLGEDPSLLYTMLGVDVVKPMKPEDAQEASVTDIGDVTNKALGSTTFTGRFKRIPPTKQDTTLAARQIRISDDRLRFANNPKKLLEVDAQEAELMRMLKASAEAKDISVPNPSKEHYTQEQRIKLISNTRQLIRETDEIQVGELGNIIGGLKGDNQLSMIELDLAIDLTNSNAVIKENLLAGEIDIIQTNAKNKLNQYAISNYADTTKVKASQVFASQAKMDEALKTQKIKPGDLYVVMMPERTKADGTVVPSQYMAGTVLGNLYKSLNLPTYLPATYVNPSWEVPQEGSL